VDGKVKKRLMLRDPEIELCGRQSQEMAYTAKALGGVDGRVKK
jgi:hypothetical protein